jgi:hypothetical protein
MLKMLSMCAAVVLAAAAFPVLLRLVTVGSVEEAVSAWAVAVTSVLLAWGLWEVFDPWALQAG